MVKINCKVPQSFLDGLKEVLRNHGDAVLDRTVSQMAVGAIEADEDLQKIWQDSLLESVEEDCAVLLKVLQKPNFGKGLCALEEDEVEGVLRAISAVRLFLRRAVFPEIPDSALEQGDLALAMLPQERRFYLAAYVFFAGLQELILQQI
ncbi:MAG: hypothetical protein LR015_14005 [Verrucomicrobia bacterium]|nr:hypothetical protein [Verrucomicrobiota bacterium]